MSKEAKILIVVSTLFTLAMGLSGIFVNVFFWRQSNSFMLIVLYNLMHYLVTPLAFVAAGWLSKKKNGIWSLRIGLMLFGIFFGLILLIGDCCIYYAYPLGILFGIASGFYWLAYNTLSFDFTSTNNRDTYNGYNGSCSGIAGAIAPITSGFIISSMKGVTGYRVVFIITLTLFVILLGISLLLRCQNYGTKLNLSKAIGKNCEEWQSIRKATFLWGFRDVIIGFTINILIIQTTGSELTLGKLTLLAALISSGAYVLVQKIVKPPRRRASVYLGAIASFVAIWGVIINVNYSTIFLYTVMDAFFLPFFLIQLSSSTFNVINRAHDEDMRIEYMINKDLVLNSGRVLSAIVLLILLNMFKKANIFRYYLIFIGAAPVLAAFYLAKLKKVLGGE
ncbi:MFS transporter [Clostridium thermarum]|uniref:MFS transporter n=1 Tax=Clostridium thermarum TaxID=1716543 RepID=UPI00111D4BC3|nr:MFS transporter [Clostridium thermarum]